MGKKLGVVLVLKFRCLEDTFVHFHTPVQEPNRKSLLSVVHKILRCSCDGQAVVCEIDHVQTSWEFFAVSHSA
jgi:hypothetical protein